MGENSARFNWREATPPLRKWKKALKKPRSLVLTLFSTTGWLRLVLPRRMTTWPTSRTTERLMEKSARLSCSSNMVWRKRKCEDFFKSPILYHFHLLFTSLNDFK